MSQMKWIENRLVEKRMEKTRQNRQDVVLLLIWWGTERHPL